jgi:4-diphosphocytidyl-2-C-methyl-D-erythritol kinase
MATLRLLAPAKINLLLQIIGNHLDAEGTSTGFHELVMVMQSISLADVLELSTRLPSQIELSCNHPQVPTDRSNLAHRAAELMMQKYPGHSGVAIKITKNIPVGAGLAGGSGNAAAVLVGLDLLWGLGLTQPELQDIGGQLGSDVPFCLKGGTALALGRGDHLAPLPDLQHIDVVLAKYRSLSVSTPWAYQAYRHTFAETYAHTPADQEAHRQTGASVPLLQAIAEQNSTKIGRLLHNDLEKVVLPAHPQVEALRQAFATQPILGTMMSGSGPTVFALVESTQQAQDLKAWMRQQFPDPDLELWTAKFCPTGIQLQPADA